MTVFRGFLTITKQNIGMMIMYIAIFLTIAIAVQKAGAGEVSTDFQATSLSIAVIDKDGGAAAKGLTEYLGNFHTIKNIPDNPSAIQDSLFYREIFYVVTIPDDFMVKCVEGNEKLPVTKVPGSNSGYYVDQQINSYVNELRILTASGFQAEEAVRLVIDTLTESSEVTLLDKNGHGGHKMMYSYMYQYMPYILLSILCYSLSYIMIAFQQPDVKRRMRCSAVPIQKQNLQMALGCIIIGLAVWAFASLLPIILYRGELLADPNYLHYLFNSFLIMLVSLSLAFLISTLVKKEVVVSPVVNVLTLGMSFLCGVFVDLDILGKGVRTVARFLPVYWYEVANGLIADNSRFSSAQFQTLCTCYGIQLLFAAVFLGVALVMSKNFRS